MRIRSSSGIYGYGYATYQKLILIDLMVYSCGITEIIVTTTNQKVFQRCISVCFFLQQYSSGVGVAKVVPCSHKMIFQLPRQGNGRHNIRLVAGYIWRHLDGKFGVI